jgi:5-methylcytosine-specific restriction endonuclease McrA
MTLARLDSYPALVLNADFRPLSYYPLSTWHWQDALKASCQDRVMVVACYELFITSPSTRIQLPSVIALKDYVKLDRRPAFTRLNVFLRDRFTCQYCRARFPTEELTFDHVRPRSRGGQTSWENIVTACQSCNRAKANRLLSETELRLAQTPRRPSAQQLYQSGRGLPSRALHQSWQDYLYWDSELEL